MKNNDHFSDFFGNIKYDDDFCSDPIWKEEVGKWLELIYKLDKDYYKSKKTDIATIEKRDAVLGEFKAIYYCYTFLKVTIFINPPNAPIDFEYEKNGIRYFVEVKSPSWRAEIFKNTSLTKEQKIIRKGEPQYKSGEGYSFSPRDAITDSIKNSLDKFKKNQKNILMIVPNMRTPSYNWPDIMVKPIIRDELKKQDTDCLIITVAILELRLYSSEYTVEYIYRKYPR